jgi:hypothetical protein
VQHLPAVLDGQQASADGTIRLRCKHRVLCVEIQPAFITRGRLASQGGDHSFRRHGHCAAVSATKAAADFLPVPETPDLRQLLALVEAPQSVANLRMYFGTDLPAGTLPRYTGGRFELLAGGGDRPDAANRITADDLIAVELLGVQVPGPVALDLLDGALGLATARHLEHIPVGVSISAPAGTPLLAPGAHADDLWCLLKEQYDMGWVITNKLLARKRPHLIPVYDGVVACAYDEPERLWDWLPAMFRERDGVLASFLLAARETAGVVPSVSPLRILDVIVWMRHRPEHQRHGCPGLTWAPPSP